MQDYRLPRKFFKFSRNDFVEFCKELLLEIFTLPLRHCEKP
ncbi:hypothetical protein [Helicobacter sp.]|nr:hypothetical protein [Helicobacter sp.]MDY5556608.1 hypothetical protein [Helicobacter sp.]